MERVTVQGSLRFLMSVAAAALAGTLAAASVPERSAAADRHAIVELENQWLDAKDAATLNRVLAEDFVHPVYSGDIIDKKQNIDWLLKHPRPANRHAHFARLEVRLFGDVGQAYGTVSVSDDSGKVISRSMFTDVFVYRDGRWQAVSAEETAVAKSPAAAN
jgi:hypothetical protein